MSRLTESVLLVLTAFGIVFIASCVLLDPAGPTTIGREFAPFALAAASALVVGAYIVIDEATRFVTGKCFE